MPGLIVSIKLPRLTGLVLEEKNIISVQVDLARLAVSIDA